MENIRCDVIIPIYNAYDASKECIESVIANTDLSVNGLILINDCSPDSRLSELLADFKSKNSKLNIEVVENEKNLGFVGTVNKGMKLSENDVLLLNSDTVVGKNWLEKIKTCAYSQPNVASVTPLSNNATLVSAPVGLQRNEVPEDVTIDQYNEILENCAYRDYPELPTSHGFCVYIRREAIETVGYFDEETFGKGYGEENDFSFRCIEQGFHNLLCDDTLVYHKESQSFLTKHEDLINSHVKILTRKYPEYMDAITNWCERFPIRHICSNLDYNRKLVKKSNVLMVIHDWESKQGGTTLHVKDIVDNLKGVFNFHVLAPFGNYYKVSSYFGDEEREILLPFTFDMNVLYMKYNRKYRELLEKVIKAFAIDTVHIHHMKGHFFDIGNVIKDFGLNGIITLHDFHSLCPTVNMLYYGTDYCENVSDKNCQKCLFELGYSKNDIIPAWQRDWLRFLKNFKKIIVPSEDTKNRILKVYDLPDITAIEHGTSYVKSDYVPKPEGVFNVAFIGVLCNHKGAGIIHNVIEKCKEDNIVFHAFGSSEIEDLTKNKNNYIFHGSYSRDNLPELLKQNNIHLVCFFQSWPETYSYTVTEAVAAGIPVLTFDIGAGANRVEKHKLGKVIPLSYSTKEIIDTICDILNDGEKYAELLENIKNYHLKTTAEMSDEYSKLYSVESPHEPGYEQLRDIIKNEPDFISNSPEKLLHELLTSTKWRIVSKIKIPKWLSRPVKKVLKGILKLVRRSA